jgi:hypothetical protein
MKTIKDFKIGDKVGSLSHYGTYGKIGVVRKIEACFIGVEYQDFLNGHSLEGILIENPFSGYFEFPADLHKFEVVE